MKLSKKKIKLNISIFDVTNQSKNVVPLDFNEIEINFMVSHRNLLWLVHFNVFFYYLVTSLKNNVCGSGRSEYTIMCIDIIKRDIHVEFQYTAVMVVSI